MKKLILFASIIFIAFTGKSQTTNDVLNLLIEKGIVSQESADSIRAEASIKQQEQDSKKKSFGVNGVRPIQIGGYGQFRYQHLQLKDQKEQAKGKNDQFAIRRAYFDIKGTITSYWTIRFQVDFAVTAKAIDLYTDFKVKDYLNFTIGQQLIPFSLNNLTSNTKLDLDDRTQAVSAFTSRAGDVLGDNNGRDIGISAFGSFIPVSGDRSLVEYRIGVFNGVGINKLDLNTEKDFIGRLLFHPIKGLDLGGSFYSGYTPDSATLNNKTPQNQLGKRQRLGAEINYTYNFLNFKAEYLVAKDGIVNKNGYYLQAAAFVMPSKIQLVGRYDTYDADSDITGNLNTNISVGANFMFTPNLLLQAAYTFRQEEQNSIGNDIASIQLQLVF